MFQTKFVKKIKSHFFFNIFPKNHTVYGIACKNIVDPHWPRMTVYYGVCDLDSGNLRLQMHTHNTRIKCRIFQITKLMHNSFILQQYVCYTTLLNMFRAARCSSSGGQIVSSQPLVSSPSVNSRTVCRWRAYVINTSLHYAVKELLFYDPRKMCAYIYIDTDVKAAI